MISEDLIRQIVRKIVEEMRPRRIVLFGSAAEGRADAHSDIDLMIVHESGLPPSRRAIPFSRLFRPRPCPMDFLVYTPTEADRLERQPASFYARIIRTGKVLYDTAA